MRHYLVLSIAVAVLASGCDDHPDPGAGAKLSTTTAGIITSITQAEATTPLPPTTTAQRWERVEIDNPDDSYFDANAVKVEGRRLVASGSGPSGCCDFTTIAWESDDGRKWRPHELPEVLDGQRFTGAHGRAGGVAVGDWLTLADCRGGNSDPCRPVAAAWWSDQAGRWQRVPDDPAVFGFAHMEHVWKKAGGYTALGHLLDDQERPAAPMIWRSTDGHRWRRHTPTGPVPVEAATIETPHGIIALTGQQAWWSPDGISWERTAVLGGTRDGINGTGGLYRAGAAALVVFHRLTPEKHHRLEVHWSGDGRRWEPLGDAFGAPTPLPTHISAVRALRHAIVAVGGYDAKPVLWESTDGRHWRRIDLTDDVFHDASVSDITEFSHRTVLVGGIELPAGNKPRAQPIAWLSIPGGGRLR